MTADFRDAFVLTGPTGAGKTALALELAERHGAEILSMDSMALYRGLDVGTAKPSAAERRRVPHHLIDVLEPWESASVAWWLDRARACAREVRARGQRVLLVGGTPLYLRALLQGLFEGPPADAELRQRLADEAARAGGAALHARLAAVDPASAARLHANDLRRVIRALEVWELTGRPISAWQQQWTGAAANEAPRAIWLDLPRAELYERINRRVERMFAEGLVDEVRALRALPRPLSRAASQALGYKEVFAHLDGLATLEETVALVQTRTRQFAKRQITWFRHLPGCRPLSSQLTQDLWRTTMDKGECPSS
jgi:tRNA dimethylallyltransferase